MPYRGTAVLPAAMAVLLLSSAAVVASAPGRAAATPARPHASRPAPTVHWGRCSSAVPARARCGYIWTPVDPTRPTLGRQRVGFELYPRRDQNVPARGTLVGQEGGPGYPSTGSRSWYLDLFGSLVRTRDVLLVDMRGTGMSDVVRCPQLQQGTAPYVRAVALCGQQLGARADTYVTAYGANDLERVLDALRIGRIDLYGDSFGTFFAQTFALRHPERLRTLTLDASYPVSGQDPWWRDTNRAIRDALTRVCQRDQQCARLAGSSVQRLRRLAWRVHRNPVSGRAPDGEGKTRRVRVDGVNLALVTATATYGTSIYRELDAAVRAFRAGYRAPLLRLVAENVAAGGGFGPARDFSAGQYAAVICGDYPQLWDVRVPPGPVRADQYRDALARLRATDPRAFDPFRIDDWVASSWAEPRTCIDWPSPRRDVPPEPAVATYPSLPVLVLSGDLDTITSPEGGREVAARFPGATFVSVPNLGHVVALGDYQGCAAGIVRRFMRSGGDVSGTGCVGRYAPVRTVPRFVRTSDRLPPARADGTTSVPDRRVVNAALYAAGDVLTRWWVNYTASGVGLAGGTFTYRGDPDVRFRLRSLRFVKDVAVTGSLNWDRAAGQVRGVLQVDGPGGRDGHLHVSWDDWTRGATASVRGRLHAERINLVTPAP